MAVDLPYPPVLGEFLDTLNGLQITHEDQALLVSIMHCDMPMNVPRRVQSSKQDHFAAPLQSALAPRRRRRRRNRDGLQRRRVNNRRNAEQMAAEFTRSDKTRQAESREQMNGVWTNSETHSDFTHDHVEDGHNALVIPWQSSDLPLPVPQEDSTHLTGACDHEEVVSSATSSSGSTPSEIEDLPPCHDYIKISWSDDDMD